MPDNCKTSDCPMAQRIEALESDNKRHGDTHKQFYKKFERINEHMVRTDERYDKLREDTAEIKESIKENTEAIKAIKDKPAKLWDGLVEKAIWAVAGAVIVFLLSQIGL